MTDEELEADKPMDSRIRNVELDVREIKTLLIGLVERLEREEERRRDTCPYRDDIAGCMAISKEMEDLKASIHGLCKRLEQIENIKTVRETQAGMASKLLDIAFKLGLGAGILKGAEMILAWASNGHSK